MKREASVKLHALCHYTVHILFYPTSGDASLTLCKTGTGGSRGVGRKGHSVYVKSEFLVGCNVIPLSPVGIRCLPMCLADDQSCNCFVTKYSYAWSCMLCKISDL
jgi:hypothetical protein